MTTTMVRPALKATRPAQVVRREDGARRHRPERRGGVDLALLGPNGAGKTTTVQILSTLIGADGGDASVAGHDVAREPDAVRDVIGVTGQFSAVDSLLTGEENLRLMADLRHLERSEPAPDHRAARAIRPGRRGSEAGCHLLRWHASPSRPRDDPGRRPAIIFLDEPTTGLDPRSRRTMWQIIRDLVDRGVTILLTTHYLEEADQLADQIAVLDQEAESPRARPMSSRASSRRARPPAVRRHAGAGIGGPCPGWGHPRRRRAHPAGPERRGRPGVRALLDRLDQESIDVERISLHTPDLDDVFLALTGHPTKKGHGHEHAVLCHEGLGDDATAQPPAHGALPDRDALVIAIPVIILLLFVYAFGGTLGAGLGVGSGGRGAYVDYVVPGSSCLPLPERRRDGDLGRDGHVRRHHRPLPHDGHLSRLGADRTRPRRRSRRCSAWRSSSASPWRSVSDRMPFRSSGSRRSGCLR